MPRPPKKEPEYLTVQETEAFFRVIRSPRDKAVFRIMYHRDPAERVPELPYSPWEPDATPESLSFVESAL
jgi:hypothetical protein